MPVRRISLLLLLAGLLGFLYFRPESRSPEAGKSRPGARGTPGEHEESRDTKSLSPGARPRHRERDPDPGRKLDIKEMLAALKVTLPGVTNFPEQTLQQRILATNALLKKAGIVLRFGIDEKSYPSQSLLEMTVPAFSQENATPNDILRHADKALKKHYILSESEGAVLFQDGSGG